MKLEKAEVLHFLIVGHTKNRWDASFDHIQPRLKLSEVRNPRSMMHVIDESSKRNHFSLPIDVSWIDWKSTLTKIFTIPS